MKFFHGGVGVFIGSFLILGTIIPLVDAKETEAEPQTYFVQRGDTLYGLAKRFYDDVTCWPLIASIPGNHAYYPGYFWAGYWITIPSEDNCKKLHQPLQLVEGAKEISIETLANVSDKPWERQANLPSTYIEGQFRSEEERISFHRTDYHQPTFVKDDVAEWMRTWQDGGAPFLRMMALIGLADGYLDRPYWPEVARVPLSEDEKENEAWWRKRLEPYVENTSRWGSWEERNLSQFIRYRDGSHWAMRVPVMVSKDDSAAIASAYIGPKSFFVIDGKETEAYYHAYGLALMPDGSWAFRHKVPDPSKGGWGIPCDPDKNDACSGEWFIKTNKVSYGPYNHPTPPIPAMDGSFWYFDVTGPGGLFILYRIGEQLATYDWVDTLSYTKDATGIVFRARRGDAWFIVKNGKPGIVWDYIDQLQVNTETDSIFYRARDREGKWYAVKNEKATLMPWEPTRLLVDGPLDETFALRGAEPKDEYDFTAGYVEIFSRYGTWKFSSPVNPEAIDSRGNILFVARDYRGIEEGFDTSTCSSSRCNVDYHFWINDRELGSGTWRALPLFSLTGNWLFKTRFGRVAISHKYYGAPIFPSFDEEDYLTFYLLDDKFVKRQSFDVNAFKRF